MEIRYFQGEILHRGTGVALKFEYDEATVEVIKATINRLRQSFYQQTHKPTQQAGGWVPEALVWYVAAEIWPKVTEELLAKSYSLVEVFTAEDVFSKKARSSKQQKDSHKQEEKKKTSNSPPPHAHRFQAKDYEVLGITAGATAADTKQAYRDMCEVWHPDRFAHNERLRQKAEAMMKIINAAYQRLRMAA